MYNPGLGSSALKRAQGTLVQTHHIRVTATLMDLNHRRLLDLSPMIQGGQVNINARNNVTRSLSIQLNDPAHRTGLDSKNPADSANYYTRMIQVQYTWWRPGDPASLRVTVPIFTGPVDTVKRRGSTLEVTAVGKEKLAMHSFWSALTIPKGLLKTDAIKRILALRTGETRFKFSKSTAKLGSALSFTREHIVWEQATKLASSMGLQMYYDGSGTLVLRPYPRTTVFTFRDGTDGSLLSTPELSYDDQEVVNVVYVKGGVPKGKGKKQAVAYATLPSNHPLNHNRLARNGVPRILLKTVERTDLVWVSDCMKVARVELDRAADQQLSVVFDALTNPMLEEGDLVSVQVRGDFTLGFRLNEMSIPFTGVKSSIGQVRNLATRRGGDKPRVRGKRVAVPKKKTRKKKSKKKSKKKGKG